MASANPRERTALHAQAMLAAARARDAALDAAVQRESLLAPSSRHATPPQAQGYSPPGAERAADDDSRLLSVLTGKLHAAHRRLLCMQQQLYTPVNARVGTHDALDPSISLECIDERILILEELKAVRAAQGTTSRAPAAHSPGAQQGCVEAPPSVALAARAGVPPPPPPPPPPPGKGGKPGLAAGAAAALKPRSAAPALKPLHWRKLGGEPASHTVWAQLPPFTLDEEQTAALRAAFANRPAEGSTPAASQPSSLAGSRASSCSALDALAAGAGPDAPRAPPLQLLDLRRANNLSIVRAQLRHLRTVDVAAAVACLDADDLLTSDQALQLLAVLPTPEECESLFALEASAAARARAQRPAADGGEVPANGPPTAAELAAARARMRDAERFATELAHVRCGARKLSLIALRRSLPQVLAATAATLGALADAARDALGSGSLRLLLSAFLRVGNELNGGTARGGARAFDVSVLAGTDGIKCATDRSVSLMEYVAGVVGRSEEGAASLRALRVELGGLPLGAEGADALASVLMQLDQLRADLAGARAEATLSAAALPQPPRLLAPPTLHRAEGAQGGNWLLRVRASAPCAVRFVLLPSAGAEEEEARARLAAPLGALSGACVFVPAVGVEVECALPGAGAQPGGEAPPAVWCALLDCFAHEGEEASDEEAAAEGGCEEEAEAALDDARGAVAGWARRIFRSLGAHGSGGSGGAGGPAALAVPRAALGGEAGGAEGAEAVSAATVCAAGAPRPRKPRPACAAARGALRVRALEAQAARGLARLEAQQAELYALLRDAAAYFGAAGAPSTGEPVGCGTGGAPRDALDALQTLAHVGAFARAVEKCRARAEARQAAQAKPAAGAGWRRRTPSAGAAAAACAADGAEPRIGSAAVPAAGACEPQPAHTAGEQAASGAGTTSKREADAPGDVGARHGALQAEDWEPPRLAELSALPDATGQTGAGEQSSPRPAGADPLDAFALALLSPTPRRAKPSEGLSESESGVRRSSAGAPVARLLFSGPADNELLDCGHARSPSHMGGMESDGEPVRWARRLSAS